MIVEAIRGGATGTEIYMRLRFYLARVADGLPADSDLRREAVDIVVEIGKALNV